VRCVTPVSASACPSGSDSHSLPRLPARRRLLLERVHYTLLRSTPAAPPVPAAHHPHAARMPDPPSTQAAASFRAPAFSSHDPSLWFTILEVNFQANNITSGLQQFSHACTLLPPDVLSQVSDTIAKASSSTTPYKDLKKAVLARLESSVATRLQELLSKEELGNEKPSDLLLRMKRLLGDKFDSFDRTLFTHLFYQRLPPALQRNLFSVKDKLELNDLAQLADDYMTSIPAEPPSTVATVTEATGTQQLVHLVSQLALEVSALKEQLHASQRQRSSSPRRPRHRSRSSSRPTHTSGVCYYHSRFGSDAIKCTQPCTFGTQSSNGTGGR